jgi:regulator of sigma E protease
MDIKIVGEEKGKEIGIVLSPQRVFRRWSVIEAIKLGIHEPIDFVILTCQFLYRIFAAEESLRKTVAGPVGIAKISYYSLQLGLGYFLWLLAIISVGLVIINLFPVLPLDGGYIPLLIIEKLRGKPLNENFIAIYSYIGFVLLIIFAAYVTLLDLGIIPR